MESFKPPRKSVLKRYLTDPLLYLGVALIVIGVSIATLYRQEKSSLVQRVSFLKGNLQIASNNNAAKSPEPPVIERQIAAEKPAVTEPVNPAPPAEAALAVAAKATVPAPAPSPALKAAAASPQVHIYYAEVPRAALEKIYEESQATGQFNTFGDYTAGILPDVAKRLSSPTLKISVLDRAEKSITKAQQMFAGVHDGELEDDIGLNTFIELGESENPNVFRGNLEVVRTWKEAASERAPASIQKSSYPAVFEMAPGAGFFIAGIMPRGPASTAAVGAHEEELTKQGPFQILKSPSFQSKESEFVIFVEFEKKP
jgi:hypothetical protein